MRTIRPTASGVRAAPFLIDHGGQEGSILLVLIAPIDCQSYQLELCLAHMMLPATPGLSMIQLNLAQLVLTLVYLQLSDARP